MLDFLMISTRSTKRGTIEVYPKFRTYPKSSDLMIRGGDFYAVWLEDKGLWSTNEHDALRLIDIALDEFAAENKSKFDGNVKVLHMWDSESGMIDAWHKYCQKQTRDSFHQLDDSLIFANTNVTKTDYASKKLQYPLEKGSIEAWDKLIGTLYSEEERHKIEWAIGAVVSGASKKLQKFFVFYGAAGTGKSTILNVIQKLFDGYYTMFSAKALGSANNSFALESFRSNPLVAIEHDADLSRIEDNTRINSLVSHEEMTVNEKFKASYVNKFNCILFIGTNKPVRITDAKSGLIRRLIDVNPSGNKLNPREYKQAVKQVDFELGAIASHCLEVFQDNPGAYDNYVPLSMMGATNDFYNFIVDSYSVFKKEDGTTLKAAWEMYKVYCEDARVPYPLSRRLFMEELKNYFQTYTERATLDNGDRIRSKYSGFKSEIFDDRIDDTVESSSPLRTIEFLEQGSLLDRLLEGCPAQYANEKETPYKKWVEVTTILSDIDTSKLHYVKVPENHIVIDFDIKGEDGEKSFERNLEEASRWPATYAELSKSGAGIHLHYIYSGDVTKLSHICSENIEVKVFTGNSSLRRKLTKCNDLPVAVISSGLPLKGEKMVDFNGIQSEKGLRTSIKKSLRKEVHSATKPNVDFIYKILEDAYNGGMKYDVSDMKPAILAFAASSTNNADYCLNVMNKMHFKSEDPSENVDNSEAPIVFFDVEVFPNLFLVNWKFQGADKSVVRMINPTPSEIEHLMKFRLIGFNNRDYDNHMLYACFIGYTPEQIFSLSDRLINKKSPNCKFREAYNLSYTDVFDFASEKMSLKKWEIRLGIHHQELGLPWDKPVPEELWPKVAEYCDNDVIATEAVFDKLKGDFKARQILAELAGGIVNDTTNMLTTKFIFCGNRKPQLIYTNLATGEQDPKPANPPDVINAFPGYEYKDGKNMYRNTNLGRGGYVYAEPGMYSNVALLDIQSMHPNSAIAMTYFGEYTARFKGILDARVAIKHKDFDLAKTMLDGKLAPYLDDPSTAKQLAQALKIAINSVYGLTSATFDNAFRDLRNVNNIVALRGALFMRTLQDEVAARGFTVAHIKTDSIKIPNATQEIINFVMDFAKKYGYKFEHEATYDRMCLVNDAVYIAKYATKEQCQNLYGYIPDDISEHGGEWTATGTQFAIPYVYKTLFTKEPIKFEDLCETKSVKSAIYLDMNEGLEDVSMLEKEHASLMKDICNPKLPHDDTMKAKCDRAEYLADEIAKGHQYNFIGKVGLFCPMKPGSGGGLLVREATSKYGSTKYDSVTGASGFRWMEAEMVKTLGREEYINRKYYDSLVDKAKDAISQYGDFTWFVSGDPIGEYPYVYPYTDAEDRDNYPYDVR